LQAVRGEGRFFLKIVGCNKFCKWEIAMKKWLALTVLMIFISGCQTQDTPPQYNPKTGQYKKVYTTGELGSHFVKDLVGMGD